MRLAALRPTDAWVRWLLVPAVASIALVGNTSYLADYWHHLARGRAIVEEGVLLDHDIFTFTVPGQPFQDVNWLSQVSYYGLHQVGGLALVRVVNAALVAVTLLWLIAMCRRLSRSLPVALGVGIAVFLGLWDVLTIRPQTFSLLLFVATMDVLERSERRPRLLVVLPMLLALWANLHGAFPAGLMLLGCWWLAAGWNALRSRDRNDVRRLLALSVCMSAAALATLLNPYGWEVYRYVGQTSNLAVARGIDEWLRPGLDTRIGLAFYVSAATVGALMVLGWTRRIESPALGPPLTPNPSPQGGEGSRIVRDALLLGCFGLLAFNSVRMVAWWLLAAAPILASRIALLWPRRIVDTDDRPNRGAAFSVAGLALAMLLSIPGLQQFNPLLALRAADETTADVHEAQILLARHLGEGRVFSRFEWGEYLSWSAHPRFKVFMDGRIEIYPDEVWQAYAQVTRGAAGWEDVLDRYRVDALVLDAGFHRRTGLLARIDASPHWQRRHEVGQALVYVRLTSLARR